MVSYSSQQQQYHTASSSSSYSSGSLYSVAPAKSICCGRWASGHRCGSCPNR